MPVLSGAKHFTSNDDIFIIGGSVTPIAQDTMPVTGEFIPDGSLYIYSYSGGSSVWIKTLGIWSQLGQSGPSTGPSGVYGLTVTGTNSAFIGSNSAIISVDTNSVYLFSPTTVTGANAINATLTILSITTPIKKDNGSGTLINLAGGDLQVGVTYTIIYNGTSFQVVGTGNQLQTDYTETNTLKSTYLRNKPIYTLNTSIFYIGVNGSDATGVRGSITQPFATLTYVNTLASNGSKIVLLPGYNSTESTITITQPLSIFLSFSSAITTPLVLSAACNFYGDSRYRSTIVDIDFQGTDASIIQNCTINSLKMWAGSHTAKCLGCYITGASRSSGSGIGILTLRDCELLTTTSDQAIAYNCNNVTINHSGSDLFLCNGNTSAIFDNSRATVTGGFNIRMGENGIFETNGSVFKANQISLKKIPSVSSFQQMLFQGCKVVSSSGTYAFISDGSASGNAAFIGLLFFNGSANKTFDPTAGTGIPAGDISSSVINTLVF